VCWRLERQIFGQKSRTFSAIAMRSFSANERSPGLLARIIHEFRNTEGLAMVQICCLDKI